MREGHDALAFSGSGRRMLKIHRRFRTAVGMFLAVAIVMVLSERTEGMMCAKTAPAYPVGLAPCSLAVADFNGDSIIDLAVANEASNDLSVLFGRGDGSFKSEVRYPTGEAPVSICAGDVDGNGSKDLVVSNSGSNTFSVFLNNGDGTFASTTPL